MRQITLSTLVLFLISGMLFSQSLGILDQYSQSNSFQVDNLFCVDNADNMLSIGTFTGTVDFDPGPNIVSLTSPRPWGSTFIKKIDRDGLLIFAKQLDGLNQAIAITAIESDPMNNFFVLGEYRDSVDFDPGPGVNWGGYSSFSSGYKYYFISKFDINGNLLWVQQFKSDFWSKFHHLETDNLGNVHFAGASNYSISSPPSSQILGGPGAMAFQGFNYGVTVLSLDQNGNQVNDIQVDTRSPSSVYYFNVDDDGQIFFGTSSFDSAYSITNNFGPGPFSMILQTTMNIGTPYFTFSPQMNITLDTYASSNVDYAQFTKKKKLGPNAYIMMGKAHGNYFYSTGHNLDKAIRYKPANQAFQDFRFGGGGVEYISDFDLDNNGNIYFVGQFSGTSDFDPGPGTSLLTSNGQEDGYLVKLDPALNFVYALQFGGTAWDYVTKVSVTSNGDVWLGGYIQDSVDFDPGPNVQYHLPTAAPNPYSIWKIQKDSCSNFRLQVDSVLDIPCGPAQGYASVSALGGAPPYSYLWNTTPTVTTPSASFTSHGIYTLTVTDSLNCMRDMGLLINGSNIPFGFDFDGYLSATSFRPVIGGSVYLDVMNLGCVPTGGTVSLAFSGRIQIDFINPAPISVVGNVVTWQLPNLDFQSSHFTPYIDFTADTTVTPSDIVCFDMTINPIVGDQNPNNNTKQYCYPFVNSYDPNDLQAHPQGVCTENYVEISALPLAYTINFQNTGNADALNIHILDTLPAGLDINSLSVKSHSHPMHTEVGPGNIVNFVFNDIHLPDSTTNLQLSKGYVIFEINADSNVASGTVIDNRAGIYFDYNAPIITNSYRHTLVTQIPQTYQTVDSAGICRGDSFTFPDGFVWANITNPVSHSSNLLSSEGCDSVVTTHVFFANTTATIQVSACSTYTSPSGAHTWTNSGIYSDTIPNAIGCDSIISVQVQIDEIDDIVTVSGDTLIASPGNTAYQWIRCDLGMMHVPTQNSQTFAPAGNGVYAVIIQNGTCTDTSACITHIVVRNENGNLSNEFSILPNPNNGTFDIIFNKAAFEGKIELFDLMGKKHFMQISHNLNKISVESKLASGTYLLRLTDNDEKVATTKIVIQ